MALITVAEARKILGETAREMSDDEIAETIKTLSELAKNALNRQRNKPEYLDEE